MKENINKSDNNTVLDTNQLESLIEMHTKDTVKNLLSEAVKNYINESILNEAEDEDNDDYEVEDSNDNVTDDVKTDETNDSTDSSDTSEVDIEDTDGDSEVDVTSDNPDINTDETDDTDSSDDLDSENSDEWSEFEQYKTDNGDYDFTGVEDDDTIVKVYKLLNDDDQVIIKKDDDKINIKDNETGAEYVIEIDPDEEISDDTVSNDDLNDNSDSLEFDDDIDDSMNENIDLGYTDNYQDEDPLTNDGMDEPANDNFTSSWDKGVPTGTKKPWAGKGNSTPYDNTITEEDEDNLEEVTTVTSNNARKMPKTHTSQPRKEHLPYGSKHISANGSYDDNVVEKIIKKARAIQEDNKKCKAYLAQLKKSLHEAAVVNVSLGQIVKLFNENSTTSKEKKSIIERFGNVTTVKESKKLYETISNELKNSQKTNVVIERQMTTTSSKINEVPVYQSNDINESLDLIRRMENL